ncbi:MAG: GrrA/OscA1 family cyclophane-containing rSAM-modified RiPP, partial [Cyanobium sp.]
LRSLGGLSQAGAGGGEARLRRISAAIREQTPADAAEAAAEGKATGEKLAFVFVNAPGVGFRNGGWGNGGFRNGGWGNGGFRNGGWGNGGGWRNGGFLNRW